MRLNDHQLSVGQTRALDLQDEREQERGPPPDAEERVAPAEAGEEEKDVGDHGFGLFPFSGG